MEKILKEIEKMQKFIEDTNAKDSRGRNIGDFNKSMKCLNINDERGAELLE